MRTGQAILLLLATAHSAAPAADVRPLLNVDASMFADDVVVVGKRSAIGPEPMEIAEIISSPPVLLAELTAGLVNGDHDASSHPAREADAELTRATRLLRVDR
jgi:hypothetical protein